MKYAFILEWEVAFSVAAMCRVLDVSTSGFYAWRTTPVSDREEHNRDLRKKVRAAFKESRGTYGSPRMRRELREKGDAVSTKKVAKLMREEGLVARKKKRFRATADRPPRASRSRVGERGRRRSRRGWRVSTERVRDRPANVVECLGRPLHDVERVEAEGRVGAPLAHDVADRDGPRDSSVARCSRASTVRSLREPATPPWTPSARRPDPSRRRGARTCLRRRLGAAISRGWTSTETSGDPRSGRRKIRVDWRSKHFRPNRFRSCRGGDRRAYRWIRKSLYDDRAPSR